MEFYDYHTHTPLCHHAEGEPEEFVESAIKKGILIYGISDHAPACAGPEDDWRMAMSDLDAYFDWVDRAKKHAQKLSGGKLSVKMGLECDWLPGCETAIRDLRAKAPWDYFIGSIHYLGWEWDFDNPARLDVWRSVDVAKVWKEYWEEYAKMAASGLFEILGHPDLIKKFGYVPEGDLTKFYEPVIEAIRKSGSAIELNTAGWDKPCQEAYPSAEFLKLAQKAGIKLLISSDAHAPNELARYFAQAHQLAQACGWSQKRFIL